LTSLSLYWAHELEYRIVSRQYHLPDERLVENATIAVETLNAKMIDTLMMTIAKPFRNWHVHVNLWKSRNKLQKKKVAYYLYIHMF